MRDALENPPSFLGNPGEPVAEVDPDDLKTFLAGGTRPSSETSGSAFYRF